MRATIQLDNSPVGQLFDVVSLPQNSVRPGRRSRLLARVPIIGARIELVGRREGELALRVAGEDLPSAENKSSDSELQSSLSKAEV